MKLAGNEIGMFTEKSEISHRRSRYDDLSDSNIVRMLRDEAQLLLEHHEREAKAGKRTVTPSNGTFATLC